MRVEWFDKLRAEVPDGDFGRAMELADHMAEVADSLATAVWILLEGQNDEAERRHLARKLWESYVTGDYSTEIEVSAEIKP